MFSMLFRLSGHPKDWETPYISFKDLLVWYFSQISKRLQRWRESPVDSDTVWRRARWLLFPKACFHKNYVQEKASVLPSHIQQFESVFTKEDFNILSNHYKWDYAIKLIPGTDSKLLKIYLLSLTEQFELDRFIAENLQTG